MGTHFHADPGNHFRSREELLEGHARPLPLPHDSMQTLGPLGVTPRSREDHVTSWEDMQTIFMMIRMWILSWPHVVDQIPCRLWDHLGSHEDHAKTTSHHAKTCRIT